VVSKRLKETLHRALAYASERAHECATLEHLLLALTDDPDAIDVFRACNVDLDRLRREVVSYLDSELPKLPSQESYDPKPTAELMRALQRAAVHVQSSGREEVTGANVIVAMFAERDSRAVYCLQEQDMTRFDALNFVSHGISKAPLHLDMRTTAQETEWRLLADKFIVLNHTFHGGGTAEKSKIGNKVFISYSHRDTRWKTRLEVHLRPIVDAGLITYWHDKMITPGDKWRKEIQSAIESAKIAILLISADFLASEFITRKEVPELLKAAEERGCQIFPIIIGPCRFLRTPALSEFQAVNEASRPLSMMKPHEREALFHRVAETIENFLQIGGNY
jgi:TIR domain/Clp amino terminal domain, pathogenicity island component